MIQIFRVLSKKAQINLVNFHLNQQCRFICLEKTFHFQTLGSKKGTSTIRQQALAVKFISVCSLPKLRSDSKAFEIDFFRGKSFQMELVVFITGVYYGVWHAIRKILFFHL